MRLAVGWRREGLTQEVIIWRLCVTQGTFSKILKWYRETDELDDSTPREDRVLRDPPTAFFQANRFSSATIQRSIWMHAIRWRCNIRTFRGRRLAARLRAHHPCRYSALTSPDLTMLGWGASQPTAWPLALCRLHWQWRVFSLHARWENTGK